jgi:rubrerythrin
MMDKKIEEMKKDLIEIFDEEYEKRRLITPQNTAEKMTAKGYRKQIEGEWEWFEEWNPSTPEHPRECDDCGWRCGECKTALADIVGGYWDNPDEKPNLNFCPKCGAKMKVGAE